MSIYYSQGSPSLHLIIQLGLQLARAPVGSLRQGGGTSGSLGSGTGYVTSKVSSNRCELDDNAKSWKRTGYHYWMIGVPYRY
jgi:hypothetical protein